MRGALATVVLALGCSSAPNPQCTLCSGTCVDLQNDTQHCGTCDVACAPGTRCEHGSCVATCAGTECNGACVDTQHDPKNCGGCGVVCPSTHAQPYCIDGQCARSECDPGWINCDFDESNGCESTFDSCVIDVCGVSDAGVARSCSIRGLSADAKRVLFESQDSFVPGDVDPRFLNLNLYVYDVPSRRVQWVNPFFDGGMPTQYLPTAAISGDGHLVTFTLENALLRGDPINVLNSYLFDVDRGALTLLQQQMPFDGGSQTVYACALSYDGRYLAEDVTDNFQGGAYRLDLDAGFAELLWPFVPSVSGITLSPMAMSRDGDVVAFNVSFGFEVFTVSSQQLELFQNMLGPFSQAGNVALSATATRQAFEQNEQFGGNGSIFIVGDAGTAVTPDGGYFAGTQPSLSADGNRLAFGELLPDGRRQCAVVDLPSGRRVPFAFNPGNCAPILSADGRTLAGSFGGPLYLVPLAPTP
jgi:hypothetical protein